MRRHVFVAVHRACWVAIVEKPQPSLVWLGHSLLPQPTPATLVVDALNLIQASWSKTAICLHVDDLAIYSSLVSPAPSDSTFVQLSALQTAMTSSKNVLSLERHSNRHQHPVLHVAHELLQVSDSLPPGTIKSATLPHLLDSNGTSSLDPSLF
jgi:hypothetical protein